jgi:hypothetical protein
VRFGDEDDDFEVMPSKMPVVTAGDEDLMERLREECRLMWSELFSDASGGGDEDSSVDMHDTDASGDKDFDSGEDEHQENDDFISDSGEDEHQENDDFISDSGGRSLGMHDTDASSDKDCDSGEEEHEENDNFISDSGDDDDKPLLKFDAVHRTNANQRLRLCRLFVDAGESDGSESEFSSAGF